MAQETTILGLESSCDDTAAAVIRRAADGTGTILSNVVLRQDALHAEFGGIVPEIAARAHAEKIDLAVERALAEAGLGLRDCDAIAVTAGPGLIGGVLAGVMCAKGLAAATGLPLIGVNHLAGHALTPRLTDGADFPYLMLLVSGGHCQFLRVDGPDAFARLGGTIDDAPGEAFDKVARLLGLPQPGGPAVEAEAASGDPSSAHCSAEASITCWAGSGRRAASSTRYSAATTLSAYPIPGGRRWRRWRRRATRSDSHCRARC